MHGAIRNIICLSLVVCVLCTSNAINAGDQTWLRNVVNWNVTDEIRIWSGQGFRNRGFSLYNDPSTVLLEIGVRRALGEKMYGGIGYRHQWHDADDGMVNENRWIAMVGLGTRTASGWGMSTRLRFDGKYYDRAGVTDYIWYRLNAGPSYQTRVGKLQLTPYAAVEIFGDTRPESKIFINRYRLHAGVSAKLGQYLAPRLGYMRQDFHNGPTDHAIRLQLIWTI